MLAFLLSFALSHAQTVPPAQCPPSVDCTRAPESAAEQAWREGVALRAEGKLKSAVMAFREAVMSGTDVGNGVWVGHGLLGVARIHAELGRLEQAADTYAQVADDPREPWEQAQLERAWCLLQLGRPDEAERLVKPLRKHRDEAWVLGALSAEGDLRHKRATQAVDALEQRGAAPAWLDLARAVQDGRSVTELPPPFPKPETAEKQPSPPPTRPPEAPIRGTIDDVAE